MPSSIGFAGPAGLAGEAGMAGFSAAGAAGRLSLDGLPGCAGLAGAAGAISLRPDGGRLIGLAGTDAPSVLAAFSGEAFFSPDFVAGLSAASILVGPVNDTLPFRPSTTLSCKPGTFFRSRSDLNGPFCRR